MKNILARWLSSLLNAESLEMPQILEWSGMLMEITTSHFVVSYITRSRKPIHKSLKGK